MPRRNSLKDEWKFEQEAIDENKSISIELILLPASQPRRYFDAQKLQQLTESIRKHGVIEPILVRPSNTKEGRYELVAGERRLRAAQIAGLDSIPVTIRELSDEESLQLSLVENLQRDDLNPLEEAVGILQLLGLRLKISSAEVPSLLYRMRNEEIGNSNQNVLISPEAETVQAVFNELATITWESFTTTRLPLLNLPTEVFEALSSGKIAYTKAQVIARVKDESKRNQLLQATIQEDLSLKDIRDRIKVLIPENSQNSPKATIESLSRRVIKAKLWEDQKKWKQLIVLLEKVESLLSDE